MLKYDYRGKTVIVTGGGKGVGRGITEAFLGASANVVICGRRSPTSLPSSSGRSAAFVEADIRDPDAVQKVVDFAREKFSRIDMVINNAGGSPPADAATASAKFSESIIRLNLIAPLVLAQAAYEDLQKAGGSIVNIASVSGVRPSPGTAAYGAAKAGLINLTQSLAMEWAPNIRVNAIIAGLIETEAATDHYGGRDGVRRIASRLPAKRMATPKDIAEACLFLSAPNAGYISGAALEVHGGGEPPSFLHFAREAVAG
ncbi:MAG: SDR family oxidoreductase [Pseudomonadota bacterium]